MELEKTRFNLVQSSLVYTIQRNPANRIMQNGRPWKGSALNCPNNLGIHPNAVTAMQDTLLELLLLLVPTSVVKGIRRFEIMPVSSRHSLLIPRLRWVWRYAFIFQSKVSSIPPPFKKHIFILRGGGFTFASSGRWRHLSRHRRHILLFLYPS
jgi:hypothetical protein